MSPLFSPSGLIYRYVLQSPDRSPQELKIHRGLGAGAALPLDPGRGRRLRPRRHDHAVPGAARSQQAVRLRRHACRRSSQQLGSNNANAGGGFYSQGGQFYYIRGLGLVRNTEDIGNIVRRRARTAFRSTCKDVAQVADRPRAAAGPVRLHEAGRRGGRRHPDARRRAGAGDPEARRGDDQGPERARAAAGREDRAVLRPAGADRGDHQDGRGATCCAACCWCW